MVLCTLLIYQPMNHSERGLLRGAIEAWRCAASLRRALRGELENVRSTVRRLALILGKKRVHSHSRPTLPVCALRLNRVSHRSVATDVSFY